jgi:signal peptidase I
MTSLPAFVPRQRAPLRVGRLLLFMALSSLILVVPLFLRVGVVEAFEAEGPSMEPTLFDEERFAVDKSVYGFTLPMVPEALASWGTPAAGDVVVLTSPRDHVKIIKRVIGLPGDLVEWRNGRPVVNGVALAQGDVKCPDRLLPGAPMRCWTEQLATHRYVLTMHEDSPQTEREQLRVPAAHVYVLGDHRDRSNDSRALGPIPMSMLVGRATYVYWSPQGELRSIE